MRESFFRETKCCLLQLEFSIAYSNFFMYIELLVLKGDLEEEGSYLYEARQNTAWN